jgi:hypothetical protein
MKKRMKKQRTQDVPSTSVKGEIVGLPTSLPREALAALIENGTAIAVASGDLLTTYRITQDSARSTTRELASYRLAGAVSAIAESNLGIVVAVEDCERNLLCVAHDERLTTICALPGTATALVAAGAQAYVVARNGRERQGRLLQVDLRQREVVSERPLDHVLMHLAVDSAGSRLVLSDPKAGKVVLLDPAAGLRPMAFKSPPRNRAEDFGQGDPRRDHNAPHNYGCCCIVCVSGPMGSQPGPDSPSTPQDPTRSPQTPTGQQDPQRPGDEGSGHDGSRGRHGGR